MNCIDFGWPFVGSHNQKVPSDAPYADTIAFAGCTPWNCAQMRCAGLEGRTAAEAPATRQLRAGRKLVPNWTSGAKFLGTLDPSVVSP
jgi:hypothetical protein